MPLSPDFSSLPRSAWQSFFSTPAWGPNEREFPGSGAGGAGGRGRVSLSSHHVPSACRFLHTTPNKADVISVISVGHTRAAVAKRGVTFLAHTAVGDRLGLRPAL